MPQSLETFFFGPGQGEITAVRFDFGAPLPAIAGVILVIAVGALAGYYAWRRLGGMNRAPRISASVLRAGALALVVFLLLDPMLVGDRLAAGRDYVALLFDDSRSMQIAEQGGRSRGDVMTGRLEASDRGFERALRRRFQVASYRFGSEAERIKGPDELRFNRPRTDIPGAIRQTVQDLSGISIAAVVLFSDGIQQSPDPPASLDDVISLGVPVYSIGVGAGSAWRDLELGELAVSRTKFDRSPLVVTAPIAASGLDGREAVVDLRRAGSTLMTRRFAITGESEEHEVRFEHVPEEKGWLEFEVTARLAGSGEPESPAVPRAALSPTGSEKVTHNNTRRFIIDNRQRKYRVLYFCGRPNWENKFVRRALAEDEEIELTSLIRISKAERKFVYRGKRSNIANPLFDGFNPDRDQPRYDEAVFLRFGPQGADLDDGYPLRAEDLFGFDLIIWGEIEHDFFSQRHLELTRDFVARRGGAFLLLGGPDSFTKGGYARSTIESMMPVLLIPPSEGAAPDSEGTYNLEFAARPTIDGALSGAWTLDRDPDRDLSLWDDLPDLLGINRLPYTRAGAAVLARADSPELGAEGAPLFAWQRYGSGRCAVLATGSTWRWQMSLPGEDNRHERLWRQIVRSLVVDVPEPITVRDIADVYTTDEEIEFDLAVRDALFIDREGLQTVVAARAPSGLEHALPVEESIQEAGIYGVRYRPDEPGAHVLSISASDASGEAIASAESAVLVEDDRREFRRARADMGFLRQIAEATGGKLIALDKINEIPDLISREDHVSTEQIRRHLWNLPIFFIALVLMLSAEWFIRRMKGFA